MQCKSCGIYMDADVYENETSPDCVFCGGGMQYTATDYLSRKDLGLVSEVRPTQIKLADQLQQAITQKEHVVVEAGTGVGKSFAYMLAAILNGRRVVISTAKKSLMSQLIEKDLPLLQKLIGAELTFAPAYGKSNYGCRKSAMTTTKQADRKAYEAFFDYADTWHWNEANDAYNAYKKANPKQSLPVLPRDHWRHSANECVGKECQHFKQNNCEYMKARAKVAASKVVVTNHWLLGYDIALRSGSLGSGVTDTPIKLLGDYHVLAVDEAHKFEEGFRTAYTTRLEDNFLSKSIDKYHQRLEECGETTPVYPREQSLTRAWGALFRKLNAAQGGNRDATEVSSSFLGQEGQDLLKEATLTAKEFTKSTHLKGLFGNKASKVHAYLTQPETALDPSIKGEDLDKLFVMQRTLNELNELTTLLSNTFSNDDNYVTYLEKGDYRRRSSISVAPIRMGGYLQNAYKSLDSVMYISATLAVGGSFEDFERRVGLDRPDWDGKVSKGVYGSSFDYKKQALLYLTKEVPQATYREGARDEYRDALGAEIHDLITASNGCAFVLFTSRVEMDHVYEYLSRQGCRLPLIRQAPGMHASEILKRYRSSTNPVLLGLKSFWEGVDVQGDQLQLVIITKLPFPGRSDPIVSARREREGNNWFSRVDLPDMVLDLRQGVGRLIRSTTDRGVVALLDQRLLTKRYKGQVLSSLGFDNITSHKQATLKALRNLADAR